MPDDARRRILERRAAFVAAALASLGAGCDHPQPTAVRDPAQHPLEADGGAASTEDAAPPMPCLEVSEPPDADAGPPPMPCLSPVYVPPDAGGTVATPPPPPMPCLSIARPPDAGRPKR